MNELVNIVIGITIPFLSTADDDIKEDVVSDIAHTSAVMNARLIIGKRCLPTLGLFVRFSIFERCLCKGSRNKPNIMLCSSIEDNPIPIHIIRGGM